MMERIVDMVVKNGFIMAFLVVGVLVVATEFLSRRVFSNRIPGAALAIVLGMCLAAFGGEKGIASIPVFSGMALLGGAMLRDFAVLSTAMGASFQELKNAGIKGIASLFIGIFISFFSGAAIGWFFGYTDAKSLTTIGAGACSFIIGPLTGSAIGASPEVITLSIAIGVIKVIVVVIGTPLLAKRIGLVTPASAMVYGGIMGTTSGVSAGLAATDMKLVPYGALTATFYTGLATIVCPSLFYPVLNFFL
jgi:malonate transporter MadM subunit